jgi:uncharacterized membrane protein
LKRKTFDKIVTAIGAGLTVLLFVVAALANWGASFAADSVSSQLKAQEITLPASTGNADESADVTAYFKSHGDKLMSTGKDAQMYADHYIAFHMSHMPTYAEASNASRAAAAALAGNPKDAALKADADAKAATVETVFKGNMLRGTLLTAYAFGTLGDIAGYAAIAALLGALVMLVLTIAGVAHLRRTDDSAMI